MNVSVGQNSTAVGKRKSAGNAHDENQDGRLGRNNALSVIADDFEMYELLKNYSKSIREMKVFSPHIYNSMVSANNSQNMKVRKISSSGSFTAIGVNSTSVKTEKQDDGTVGNFGPNLRYFGAHFLVDIKIEAVSLENLPQKPFPTLRVL